MSEKRDVIIESIASAAIATIAGWMYHKGFIALTLAYVLFLWLQRREAK